MSQPRAGQRAFSRDEERGAAAFGAREQDRVSGPPVSEYPPLPLDEQPAIRRLEALLSESPVSARTPSDGSPGARTESAPQAARSEVLPHLDAYEILEPLGRGGMGIVYKARQLRLNRIVAIKTLPGGALAGSELLVRFRAEAEAAARLKHANIVPIYEISESAGVPFFSMEYVEGGSLDRCIRTTALGPGASADLVRRLADAIQAAHEAGVIHRDLKPSNVLMTADGIPKISDFGLAKLQDPTQSSDPRTRTGAVLGTPNYMAPEQAAGRAGAIGPATDVHALGAILYELLTGRPPFRAADALQTLEQVRTCEPVSPRRLQPGLPRDLVTICLKCLEKDPRKRYSSAAQLSADLQNFRAGRPISARPIGKLERLTKWIRRRPWQAAVIGLALATAAAAAAGVALHRHQHGLDSRRAAAAEAEARAQRIRAVANLQKGHETLGLLLTRMEQDEARSRNPRAAILQREVEETALRFCSDILKDLEGDFSADGRLSTARVLNAAAEAHRLLGQAREAIADLQRARDVLEALIVETPDDPTRTNELADCRYHEADIELVLGQMQQAEAGFREALSLDDSVLGSNPGSTAALKNRACCYWRLTSLYETSGKGDQAAESAALAANSWSRLLDSDPADNVFRSQLGLALKEQIRLDVARGHLAAADSAIDRAVAILTPMLDPFPTGIDALWGPVWLAEVYREWGLRQVGTRPREAVAKYSEAIGILDRVLQREPQLLRGRVILSQVHTYRSMVYESLGMKTEMIHDRERACEFADGIHHHICRIDLARMLVQIGDYRRAVAETRAAVGAGGTALPLTWRMAAARNYASSAGVARGDQALAAEERAQLCDEYARLALYELNRCRELGYFADENARNGVESDRGLESIRGLPKFKDFVRKIHAPAAPARVTSAPADPVPAGNK